MNNLFRFIIRHYIIILFALLESLSLYILVQNNNFHRAKILNIGYEISGAIYNKYNEFTEYFFLKDENLKLSEENSHLRNLLYSSFKTDTIFLNHTKDSLRHQQYSYISAKVVHNSVNMQNNFIVIDKGRKHGIKEEMAVISPNGIVGIIKNVGDNFSTVISLLNSNLRVSAKVKRNGYFGSIIWDGRSYNKVVLNEIPVHIKIRKNDTIVTSGYSTIFPEGILVGKLEEFSFKGGDNFYTTKVALSTDFKSLNYVYVVRNMMKDEVQNLNK